MKWRRYVDASSVNIALTLMNSGKNAEYMIILRNRPTILQQIARDASPEDQAGIRCSVRRAQYETPAAMASSLKS